MVSGAQYSSAYIASMHERVLSVAVLPKRSILASEFP